MRLSRCVNQIPGENAHAQSGKNLCSFASATDKPVDTTRVGRTLTPTGSGGGICALGSADELEVGDDTHSALETKEAELGTLEHGIDLQTLLSTLLAN